MFGVDLQFFLVSIVEGLAEVIMPPAFWAREIRKSWISWSLGSAMAADRNYGRWWYDTNAVLGGWLY